MDNNINIEYDRENTISAWHQFIETGIIPEGKVRKSVAESWLRCRQLDVDPFSATYPHMSRQTLKKMQSDYHTLLSFAIPCIHLLHTAACSGGASISSPDLFTYYMFSEFEHDPLSYGIYLDERTCGNTAVSIAHYEKASAFLHKYEKYRVVDQSTSAAAAPIWIGGSISGYLSLNGTVSLSPEQMIRLVEAAAEAISRLCSDSSADVISDIISGLINMAHRPILLLDSSGNIIASNNDCRRFIKVRNKNGSPENLVNILVNKEDINGFIASPENAENYSTNIRTIYGNTFNCEILFRDSICFPGIEKYTAVVFDITPPGRQVKASSRNTIISIPSRSEQFEYIGSSMAWAKIDNVIKKVAHFPSNVFIQGESGTGKEVVAKTIHNLSGRTGQFVAINCGDIPEGLLQSELFGYEKGSFTGANREGSIGKFEYADHGTVFLDEIGDMPLSMQVSLLRFIQERTIQRIGSNKQKAVDVRIIAATNKNVEQLIKDQLFRVDLYYRLNIIGLTLPPLRDRKEDIPPLAQYFVKKISEQYGMAAPAVDDDVYSVLMRYDWPGNVRELRNAMEKLLIMSEHERITVSALYTYVFDYDTFNSLANSSQSPQSEEDEIREALSKYHGNVTKAAALLGIARDTLYRKMNKYGIKFDRKSL